MFLSLVTMALFSFSAHAQKCDGFLPKNDVQIPVGFHTKDSDKPSGLSEEQFNTVLDKVDAVMRPIFEKHGGNMVIKRNWTDATFNAYAHREGKDWIIEMFGGLARHPSMTPDGFTVVACHESGHHLGGAPKVADFFGGSWAANEGQADYFATTKCLKQIYAPLPSPSPSVTAMDQIPTPMPSPSSGEDPTATKKCKDTYKDAGDQVACLRSTMAGLSLAGVLHELKKDKDPIALDTPDARVVSVTDDQHPASQCRLDTYFQGALCVQPYTLEFSDSDAEVGACTEKQNHTVGMRPLCWFKPGDATVSPPPFDPGDWHWPTYY